MVNLPATFTFVAGRPCVQIDADGLSSIVTLTFRIDFRSANAVPQPDYDILLFPIVVPRLRIRAHGSIGTISTPFEMPALAQSLYVGVTWWTHHLYYRTSILPSHLPAEPGIDGYVSLGFFPNRTIAVIESAADTVIL